MMSWLDDEALPAASPPASGWLPQHVHLPCCFNFSADDELVDDEALLTEEDKARPAAPAGEAATAC